MKQQKRNSYKQCSLHKVSSLQRISALSGITALMLILMLTAVPAAANLQKLQAAERLDNLLIKAPDQKVTNLTVAASTMDSVTLTWTKASDAETYYISYWESGKPGTSVDKDDIGNVSEYKITNLKQAKYFFQVQPANKLRTGIPLKGSAAAVEGAPGAAEPTGVKFHNIKAGYCSLYIEGLNDIYKSEAELYDCSGNLLESCEGNSDGAAIEESDIKNNGFYAVRVRGFYDQEGGFRSYGDWTDLYYFSTPVKPLKISQKNGKAIVKWTNVQGAQSYTVYMSKSASGGFKKAAETKNASATIAKLGGTKLKSKKTYYVRVTAYMTKDGETYKTSSATGKIKIK